MSTFLFLIFLTLVFLQKNDINETFKKQQRFWKLNKNWQSYCPLNIGTLVMFGALVILWRRGDASKLSHRVP